MEHPDLVAQRIVRFAQAETLQAHASAVQVRLDRLVKGNGDTGPHGLPDSP